MDGDWKPSENDVSTVLEAHGLIPSGLLLEEASGLASLYADLIRKRLEELHEPVSNQKVILAILEEGFMQEGIIPNSHKRQFEMPVK